MRINFIRWICQKIYFCCRICRAYPTWIQFAGRTRWVVPWNFWTVHSCFDRRWRFVRKTSISSMTSACWRSEFSSRGYKGVICTGGKASSAGDFKTAKQFFSGMALCAENDLGGGDQLFGCIYWIISNAPLRQSYRPKGVMWFIGCNRMNLIL